jgi:L-histidine Nalpha-methyltransferase
VLSDPPLAEDSMRRSSVPITKRFLTPDDLGKSLRQDVADGLTAFPKTLPPKWFYDERGSELFEEITRLEEY